eukprot:comp21122_c0_seq1/m.28547 comp21122_c0_seq1/g.28547  ORF comp21122_c0_seq1/g.28547 comp21122_c0_seq1/m.28547 type:complete len:506 (-) comp21122_c0_seq1:45-1562(-)
MSSLLASRAMAAASRRPAATCLGRCASTLANSIHRSQSSVRQLPWQAAGLSLFLTRSFHSSPAWQKVIQYKLADIGEGIAEAEVLQWFVDVGDQVQEFDRIAEVQSDKATVEITSRYTGTIKKRYYGVGDMAKVHFPLVEIDTQAEATGEDAPSEAADTPSAPPAAEAQPAPVAAEQPGQDLDSFEGRKLATPAVRRIAKDNGIDIRKVKGTGKEGRVLKEDVVAYMEGMKTGGAVASVPVTAAPTAAVPAPAAAAPTPTPMAAPTPIFASAADQVLPIRGIQKAMVKSMNAANMVPHFTYCDEITLNRLADLRNQLKPMAAERGINLSFLPFFMKATSLALRQYPTINSHVNEDCSQLTIKGAHNIGFAMDTKLGLLVPNVKNVQERTIMEIAMELNRMQKSGIEGKLPTEDLAGATITISNIGSIGGTYMRPVILVPTVAIAALGKAQTLPRYDAKGNVYPASIVNVSWSGDHRVLDGATMARFSNLMKSYIENPETMIFDMK